MNRKTILKINSALVIIFIIAIAGALYYIADRHPLRYDTTENKIRSLSDQTKKVLDNLEEPVEAVAFVGPGMQTQYVDVLQLIDDLLLEYDRYSGNFSYRVVDPERNPAEFQSYGMENYGVVFLSGGDKVSVPVSDLFEIGYSQYGPTAEGFTGEQGFTNAIVELTSGKKKTVCFTAGHRERSIEGGEDRDYSGAARLLEAGNYRLKTVELLLEKNVPADCDVLAVAGPEELFAEDELKAIDEYLDARGRGLFLLDPMKNTAIEQMLHDEWGIQVGDNIIVDRARFYGDDVLSPIPILKNHDITNDLIDARLSVSLFLARSVSEASDRYTGADVDVLMTSSDDSWAESDLDSAAVFDENSDDIKGPVPLAVALSKDIETSSATGSADMEENPAGKPDTGENGHADQARLVVVGDADFASDIFVSQSGLIKAVAGGAGNTDFLLNAVSWLAGEEELISIRPKPLDVKPLDMTGNRPFFIYLLFVLVIPIGLVIMGTWIWVRRRSM